MSDYFHYFEALTNTSGDSLIGYFFRALNGTDVAPIYADDSGTPIVSVSGRDNMSKTDAEGNVSFYITPGTYNIEIYGPDGTTFYKPIPNVPMTSTQGPPGPQGVPGTAGNVDPDLASLKAALTTDVARIYDHAVFKWTTGDYTGQADDTNIIQSDNAALTVGAWVRQLLANIQASDGNSAQANLDAHTTALGYGGTFTPSGTGAQTRPTATRLLESVLHATDYGADSSGAASAKTALLNTAAAARQTYTDGPGRVFSKRIHLTSGKYKLDDIANLAASTGTVGLIIEGDGATEIDYAGSAATLKFLSSRRITFKDIVFKSSGIDDNQVAFTIVDGGNPLVGCEFWNCEFQAFYKCFDVTGGTMCSEFVFYGCKFSNCYRLMNNANVQAVNWSFYGCDWDNNSLTTTKDKTLAAMFYLTGGTKVNWYGGSIIFWGRMVLFNLTVAGQFQRVAHSLHFKGCRIELQDEGGSHVPIIDRIDTGYVNGTNQPTVTLEDIDLIKLGTIGIGNDISIARIWANCSLTIRDCHWQTCHVTGVIDSNTATAGAQLVIENCSGIGYQEDTTNRVSDHDQHNVKIRPNNTSAGTALDIDQRGCSISLPVSIPVKRLRMRGPTGSVPQGGTTINLPSFPTHTEILRVGVERFGTAAQSLTADLRDQADTTSYGSVALASTDQSKVGIVNKEMGFQIPAGTALMLKFTGTVEIVKGFAYVDYQ